MKRTVILISLIFHFSFLLQIPPQAEAERSGAEPRVVKIGLVAPLSGERKWIGERILKGVRLAISTRPEEQKVEIRLSIEDTRGDPSRAAPLLTKLGKDQDMLAVIGPALSECVTKAASAASEMRIPTISPTAVSPGIAALSPYLFRNGMTVEMETDQLTGFAMKRMGLTTFAVLYPLNPMGQKANDDFGKLMEKNGGKIIYSLSYQPSETDFGKPLKQIGGKTDEELDSLQSEEAESDNKTPQMEYQSIFIPGDAASSSLILASLKYYNITGVKLLGTRQWNSPLFLKRSKGYSEGAVFIDGFFSESPWPQVEDFVKSYKTAYDEEPDIISAQAFDSASILLDLIRSGARDREAIKEGLLDMKDYPGVSGYTTFLPSGEPEKELFILTVRNGKVIQIN